MRRLFFGIFLLGLLTACDDGEIIVTNFDFEDSTLRFCDAPDRNVIYAINDDDVFESISLEFNSSQFDTDEDGNLIPPDEAVISFPLTGNNRVTYRIYDGSFASGNNSYFCSAVPPSEPKVIEEWISGTGGTVFVTTGFTDESANADPDGDGLSNIDEGWVLGGPYQDTDEDSIPDYLDKDDDGDNVLTSTELANGNNEPVNDEGLRDFDEDGIPNYLDDDDDNDGVLTRLEVSEDDLDSPENFQTAEGISNYLNVEQTAEISHDEYIGHDISRNYGYRIDIDNLKFDNQNGSGESIQYENYNLGTLMSSSVAFPQCPLQDETCSDPEPEEPEESSEETN
ncbi:hypothetical protein [Christiangramia echinicola]|uniref:Thrombospondin type 3 repeat-containing protein n=1 Tax=Christiangramia echinicola TaxID=279359 RepID=A0A1H1R0N2_9FLAO|nr:hypothetical protein [Christiangramia echinicola]SDS29344.1 hypothetical protein SAMN04488552_2716 [Christiangramia echinicola]